MSWFVLAPTIAIAVIIAAAILIKPGEATPRINFGKQTGEAAPPSVPLPTLATWVRHAKAMLRNARQPVSPIDYSDLGARASRGIKVAGLMVIVALMLVAQSPNNRGWVGVLIVLAVLPFCAIGGLISVTHTLVLRMLPYRGPIVSTALAGLLGFAAAYVLRDSMMPGRGLVIAGVVYGAIIGVIDFSIAQEKASKPEPLARQMT
ncbi:MAG: hypothetical protein ACXWCX_09730 [Burkholderiales bacterium]